MVSKFLNKDSAGIALVPQEIASLFKEEDTFYAKLAKAHNSVIGRHNYNDLLIGSAGVDFMSGGSGNDFLFGGAGHDNLKGGTGNDRLDGGDGNDILIGQNGNDEIFGGSGIDKAVQEGKFSKFRLEANLEDNTIKVTGRKGIDIIHDDVEFIKFTDKTISVKEFLDAARAAHTPPPPPSSGESTEEDTSSGGAQGSTGGPAPTPVPAPTPAPTPTPPPKVPPAAPGTVVREHADAVTKANVEFDGHTHFDALLNSPDLIAAYSFRDQLGINKYSQMSTADRRAGKDNPFITYDADMDAAKVIIGAGKPSLASQIRVPFEKAVLAGENVELTVQWEARWDNVYLDVEKKGFSNHKAFQLARGEKITTEIQTAYSKTDETAVGQPQIRIYGKTLLKTDNIITEDEGYRDYQPGGDTEAPSAKYSATDHLSGIDNKDPFLILGNTWVRFTVNITIENGEDRIKMWMSDENHAPVLVMADPFDSSKGFLVDKHDDGNNLGLHDAGLDHFWIEMNTSSYGMTTSELTMWVRNLAVFKGDMPALQVSDSVISNDKIVAATESDNFLYGGGGADEFLFSAIAANTNLRHVADFDTKDGDKIVIKDVLSHYTAADHAISDFVSIRETADGTIVSVDKDGAHGAGAAQDVMIIDHVLHAWTNVDDMASKGNLTVL